MNDYTSYIGLGIAGNFALHLEQAGESADFKDVITQDPNGPKGMFPFYIPQRAGKLGVYPLSHTTIILPLESCNVQPEPEVALVCTLTYDEEGKVTHIQPTFFGAYNDCSLRKEGAAKISHKKNWGASSKGISQSLIPIDRFENGGIMDTYRIASFVRREGEVVAYGEDVELLGYSYFYTQLLAWIKNQINTQIDQGPLEAIGAYIRDAHSPQNVIISIGATRYTPFGETHFVHEGDEIIVVVYDGTLYAPDAMVTMAQEGNFTTDGMSYLRQKVVRG